MFPFRRRIDASTRYYYTEFIIDLEEPNPFRAPRKYETVSKAFRVGILGNRRKSTKKRKVSLKSIEESTRDVRGRGLRVSRVHRKFPF